VSSIFCPDCPRGRLFLAAMAAVAGLAAFAGYLESAVSSDAPAPTAVTAVVAVEAAAAPQATPATSTTDAGGRTPDEAEAAARQDRREWQGTTAGNLDVDVRPGVAGRVLRRDYAEGTLVQRGDLLFEIDPRPFQARLARAQAELSDPVAARGRAASVAALQAAVDQARLDLESTVVRSPITGVAAATQARPGDLVNPTSVLVTVSSIDPIHVRFRLAERDYLRYLDTLRPGTAAAQRFGELELEPAGPHPVAAHALSAPPSLPSLQPPLIGRLIATDHQVDLASRTIGVTGLFPNPGSRLRPGQLATIRELGLRDPGLEAALR
jgi:multidrug efflux pump subunit AcrA (membrane-fusion protein)